MKSTAAITPAGRTTALTSRTLYAVAKRGMDVVLAMIGLIALSPVMAAIAIAIRLDSAGPALFRQQRLGRFGVEFVMFKFRSMRLAPAAQAPQVTAAGDQRVTRVGRFLRRYKVDELPQLLNVLNGDMSLVGPRPEVRRYAEYYPVEYEYILSIRPGITDFASLEFRHEEELLARSADPERTYVREVLPAKIHLYLRYLEERSLPTDLFLVARTIRSVLE
jgi:lipopolysaccharide/colanic/teichoic acid biosynthesis glycosyltransferase